MSEVNQTNGRVSIAPLLCPCRRTAVPAVEIDTAPTLLSSAKFNLKSCINS